MAETSIQAQLKRKSVSGDVVDWLVNDDGSEPTSDATTHDLLSEILTKIEPEKRYLHMQSVPSALWIVPHNLGLLPQVTVMNSAGQVVEVEVIYENNDIVHIAVEFPFSGVAILTA